MSGIGFELHRLLKSERREHQAAAARQSINRASAPWGPPMAMIGAAGAATTLAIGQSAELEPIAAQFTGMVSVSLLASAIPAAAVARIASDPHAPIVRPLVLANLIATALTVFLLLLLWPLIAAVFELPMSQSTALSAALLSNVWPPFVALVLRRQLRHTALPAAATVFALVALWYAVQFRPGDLTASRFDIALCLIVIAAAFGGVIGLALRLDDNVNPDQRPTPANRIDYTAWAPALFTVVLLGDRVMLSLYSPGPQSMLHATAPALIGMLCVIPAAWYLVKSIEPRLCQHRAKLMETVYEGESLEHIEQQLESFSVQSVSELNTLAKILGVSAVAGFLIGPDLLAVLNLDPDAIVPLQLAIVSSAMLTQFMASIAMLLLLQLRSHAFAVTAMGLLLYLALAVPAFQGNFMQPPMAATLAACMTSLLTLALVRQSIDILSVDMLID